MGLKNFLMRFGITKASKPPEELSLIDYLYKLNIDRDDIISYLQWESHTFEKKVEILQETENLVMKLYGLDPYKIVSRSIDRDATCDHNAEKIIVDTNYLNNTTLWSAADILFHEIDHILQLAVVKGWLICREITLSNDWKENFTSYIKAKKDLTGYLNQPIEAHANQYSVQARKIFEAKILEPIIDDYCKRARQGKTVFDIVGVATDISKADIYRDKDKMDLIIAEALMFSRRKINKEFNMKDLTLNDHMKYIYLYHGWKWLPDSQKRDVLQTYLDEVMYEDGKTSYAVEIQDSSRMGEKEARADRNKNVITLSSSLLYENLSYHCNENTNSDVANVLLCVTGFPTGSEQYTLKERPAGDYFRKSVMETKALLVLISDYCDRKDRGTTNIEIKGVSRNAINVDQTELIITEANIAHQKKYIAEQFDKIKRNSSTLDQKVYEDVKDVINDLNDFKSRLIQNLYIRQRVTKTFEEDVEVDHANNKCIERANTELNRLYDEYLNLGDKNGFLDNCCNVFLTGLGIIGKNTAAYVRGSQGQVRTTLSEKMQEINESKENNNVNMGPRKGIIREQQMRAQ